MFVALAQATKCVKKGVKPSRTMTVAINKFLARRPKDVRRPGIHVTTIINPCIRKVVYKLLNPEAEDGNPKPDSQKIFDNGKAVHEWWQNKYYGPMGILIGKWKCSTCGTITTGAQPKHVCGNKLEVSGLDVGGTITTSCEELDTEWVYVEPEVHFKHAGLLLTGNCDGELLAPKGRTRTLEMKSMDPHWFKDLDHPNPKDILQASIYALLLDHDEIMVSYIHKSTWKTKDYIRKPNKVAALNWIKKQLELIAKILDTGDPLRAPKLCTKGTSGRAMICAASKLCF